MNGFNTDDLGMQMNPNSLDRRRREMPWGSPATTPTAGRWEATTETSVYLLDLDDRRVTRVPDAGAGPPPGLGAAPIAALGRDHEPVPLLALISCAVGRPMRMMIDIRRDGVGTLRTTTIVRRLRELPAWND